jgi:hypothetical protein
MRKRLVLSAAVGLALAILGPGCDKLGGETDGGKVTPVDSGPPPTGIVTLKTAGGSAEANFADGKEFLVVPYSVSDVSATGISFDIALGAGGGGGSDAGLGSSSSPLRLPPLRSLRETNPALWARWQKRLAVEAWSRSLAEKAAASLSRRAVGLDQPLAGATCKLSKDCDPNEVCAAGTCASTVTIKTGTFSGTATIETAVKKKGKVGAILVDTGDTVDEAALGTMLDQFEKVIYPRDVALFGDPELKAGSSQTASDRNADGLVWLVFTSKVKEKNAAVGFFAATDFDAADPKSNQADILYIDSAAKAADAYTIMAHELQHLLNFGAKVYRAAAAGGQGALEALWLDEGQAHLAEDACGYGGENVTLLNQEVFIYFGDTSLFETQKDGLPMRGMAFTFIRYLFEQKGAVSYNADGTLTDKGGAAMLRALHTSSKQGTAAISAVAAPDFTDFKGVFDYWITAVALDGRGATTYPKYIFQDLVSDPLTGAKIGVKIRGTRKDNTGADVNLEGPPPDPISGNTSGTIPNATGKFYLLKDKSGKVSVSVTSKESDIRFALIKIK